MTVGNFAETGPPGGRFATVIDRRYRPLPGPQAALPSSPRQPHSGRSMRGRCGGWGEGFEAKMTASDIEGGVVVGKQPVGNPVNTTGPLAPACHDAGIAQDTQMLGGAERG